MNEKVITVFKHYQALNSNSTCYVYSFNEKNPVLFQDVVSDYTQLQQHGELIGFLDNSPKHDYSTGILFSEDCLFYRPSKSKTVSLYFSDLEKIDVSDIVTPKKGRGIHITLKSGNSHIWYVKNTDPYQLATLIYFLAGLNSLPNTDSDNAVSADVDYVEVVDVDYIDLLSKNFEGKKDIAYPLFTDLKTTIHKIEDMLYTVPSFINAIKASIPEESYQLLFTDEQKQELAKGAIELITQKDGKLIAQLRDTSTKKFVSKVAIEKVTLTPEITQALSSYATQMQLAQIASQIREIQGQLDQVRQGLENDRLAIAYSCEARLAQAATIKNPQIKENLLLSIASAAEESRNQLMLSQKMDIEYIISQPEGSIKKLMSGESSEKTNERMMNIRKSFEVINRVSLTEAIAYHALGEDSAAKCSLDYYTNYIKNEFLADSKTMERLDMLDSTPDNYWSQTIPSTFNKISALPAIEEIYKLEA